MTDSTWVPIRDKIVSVFKFIIPLISTGVSLFGGGLPKAAQVVINALPKLMAIAEEACPEGGGPAKKQFVMDGADKVLALVGGELTGNAAENYAKYKEAIGLIIDSTITVVNAVNKSIVADDQPFGGA